MEKETSETQPQETPQIPALPTKLLSLPIVALVVLVALVVGGSLGYYLGNKTNVQTQIQTQDQTQTQPTAKTTPTLQPEPDPTADWETYTNNEYGFSIRYPQEANLTEVNPGYVSITGGGESARTMGMIIFSSKNTEGLSRRYFYAKQSNANLDEILPHLNIQEIPLGNSVALRIVHSEDIFTHSSFGHATSYMIENGENMYEIDTFEYTGKFNGEETTLVETPDIDSALTQQILSTFEFID